MNYTGLLISGQDSRLLDLTIKDFCYMLNKKNISYIGPTIENKEKIDGEIFHYRKVIFDKNISFEIVQNFGFPSSVTFDFIYKPFRNSLGVHQLNFKTKEEDKGTGFRFISS